MFAARETLAREPATAVAPSDLQETDALGSWFLAAEDLGEYIGIRFGQIHPARNTPEWTFLRHAEFDGIGGFTELLRRRGVSVSRLPQIKHPALPSGWLLLRAWAKYAAPRSRVQLGAVEGRPGETTSSQAPSAVAWHVFDEEATVRVRRVCRRQSITVNSFLLKHLTKAIRPFLLDQAAVVPWMIPVNMRGRVAREKDTSNYSSYVGVKIRSYETALDIHKNIYRALGRAEHWANWYAYLFGKFIGPGLKKALLKSEYCTSQWNLGGFSNLGDWDADKEITQQGAAGPWLFCPPVLRCQLIGAGVVTFQNRLSLTIQAHPELTTSSNTLWLWIQNWIKEIQLDLSSILTEAA